MITISYRYLNTNYGNNLLVNKDPVKITTTQRYEEPFLFLERSYCMERRLVYDNIELGSVEIKETIGNLTAIISKDDGKGYIVVGSDRFHIDYNSGTITRAWSKKEKAPIEIEPIHIWKEKRYQDLCEAIKRYLDADKEIPIEWVEEYNTYIKENYEE